MACDYILVHVKLYLHIPDVSSHLVLFLHWNDLLNRENWKYENKFKIGRVPILSRLCPKCVTLKCPRLVRCVSNGSKMVTLPNHILNRHFHRGLTTVTFGSDFRLTDYLLECQFEVNRKLVSGNKNSLIFASLAPRGDYALSILIPGIHETLIGAMSYGHFDDDGPCEVRASRPDSW